MNEPTPTQLARALDIDTDAAMRGITEADAEHIKAALGAMVDGKIAALRDGDTDTAQAASSEALQHLWRLTTGGAVLFGDIATGISKVRLSVLLEAQRRG